MSPGVIQNQNKHNTQNQIKFLGKELYEYYFFWFIQKMNNSRHYVHYLISKSNSISLKAIYHDIMIYQISIS